MTRALLPLLGRSLLMLALCGAAVGCGDDDDDDDAVAGTGGKSGSGGKGGSSGKGGAGGATAPTKAECVKAFDKVSPLPTPCVECACDENATSVTACGEECWALIECVGAKCADVITDEAQAMACAGLMCGDEVAAAGPKMQLIPATVVGPILTNKCAAKCIMAPPIPEPDASVEEDAGVDAGS